MTFSIDSLSSAVCSISAHTVTFLTTGTCTIDANQVGVSGSYSAAQMEQQQISVGSHQTVSVTSTPPTHPAVSSTYSVHGDHDVRAAVAITIDLPRARSARSLARR